jgi:hypothetical protein
MSTNKINIVCTHVEDETNHFGDEFCDLRGIKNISGLSSRRISGHIHLPSDNYLGSALITRYDERGKDSFIAVINPEDPTLVRKHTTPVFLDYYTIKYGDDLPQVEARYPIWNVTEAPSEDAVIDLYGNLNYRDISKYSAESMAKSDVTTQSNVPIKEHFLKFAELNNISNKLRDRLLRKLV